MRPLTLLVVVAALALLAVAASPTEAKRHQHRDGNAIDADGGSQLLRSAARYARRRQITEAHPSTVNRTLGSREDYADIWAALEARNFSRPTPPSGGKSLTSGYLGVDVPVWVSQNTWSCLKSQHYTFAIVRAGQSNCIVDPNGVHTVANAWAGGIDHVDIYIFPSQSCGLSATQQVKQTIEGMGSIPFGTLWFDIEPDPHWSSDVNRNHAWMIEGVKQATSMIGANRIGIYASKWAWSVMGSYSDFSNYPLWWANYDNSPSMDNFVPFAGWQKCAMKQFNDRSTICGLYTDVDSY